MPFKFFKRLFRLIYTSFVGFLTGLTHPFINIFKGETIAKRIGGILFYATLVLLFIFLRPVFFIMLGFIFFLAIFSSYRILQKSWKVKDAVDSKVNDLLHNVSIQQTDDIGMFYFFGKNPEDAKKEYRALLKKYHPDNPGGSEEKTTRITEAYEYYQLDQKSKMQEN